MAGESLVIPVGATIKDLERAMRAARKESAEAAREVESRWKRVDLSASFGTGVLKGAIAGLTADRLIRGFADANAELVRIGETAKRVGLDLQSFQELQFAGRQKGLAGKDFGSGLEGLAEKLNEAGHEENKLSKLFEDNNLKLKDREGKLLAVNQVLGEVANLVRNAATEFDKIKIAEAVGLTKEWVPLLEQGAEAISQQAARAREAGAVIDADVIQKAKDFERDWAAAVDRWSTMFRANLGGIIGLIDAIIARAGALGAAVSNYAEKVSAEAELRNTSVENASRDTLNYVLRRARETGATADPSVTRRLSELDQQDREANRGRGFERVAERGPLEVSVRGKRTDTSSLYGGGSKGGGGGKDEDDKAQARLEKYIETLMRQNSVLDAEIASFGKSNAEKRAAIELAKAQVDLAKLDEEARQKIIAGLTREIELSEKKRTTLKSLQDAQKGLQDAQKFVGEAAVDALEDLMINGAKAEDVIKRLVASLAKAALQAALLGQGPLAGIFGTTGANGNVGGLFGLLFGGSTVKAASGGYVSGPGSGRSDSIPARLSNGEYVVNAASTRRNRALLEAINSGRVAAFADGGLAGAMPTIPALRAGGSGDGVKVVVNNTMSDQAQATAQRGDDGSLKIMIEAIKGDIAQDLLRGQGSIGAAFGAVRTGRQLRG